MLGLESDVSDEDGPDIHSNIAVFSQLTKEHVGPHEAGPDCQPKAVGRWLGCTKTRSRKIMSDLPKKK